MKTKINKRRQLAIEEYVKERDRFLDRLRYASKKQNISMKKLKSQYKIYTKKEAINVDLKELRKQTNSLKTIKSARIKEDISLSGKTHEAWTSLYRKDQVILHNFYQGIGKIIEGQIRTSDADLALVTDFMIWFSNQSYDTQLKILSKLDKLADVTTWNFIYASGGTKDGGESERLDSGTGNIAWVKDLIRVGEEFGYSQNTKRIKSFMNKDGHELWTLVNKDAFSNYVSAKTVRTKYADKELSDLTFLFSLDESRAYFKD